jgi:hypothetical protein
LPGGCEFDHRTVAVFAALRSCAVQIALSIARDTGLRKGAVRGALKAVEHGFLTGGAQLKHDPVVFRSAAGHAIEIAVGVADQAAGRSAAIGGIGELMEDLKRRDRCGGGADLLRVGGRTCAGEEGATHRDDGEEKIMSQGGREMGAQQRNT